MARSYGNNTEATAAAREALEKQQSQEKETKAKIELIVIIVAIAISVLSIVINTVRCISAVAATSKYKEQTVEAQAEYDELYAKLQDPESQNFSYVDPTVGNMSETGKAIALMQNQLIAVRQSKENLTLSSSMADAPGSATATVDDVSSSEHDSTTSETGGAVTLDPTDVAPTESSTTDANSADESEATISVDDSTSDSSNIEYTPISDFFSTPTDSTTDATASENSTTTTTEDTAAMTSALSDEATLRKDFKTKYFSQPANVDTIDPDGVMWSWYGVWEFSATYDYALQGDVDGVPQMKAVWVCYEPSDINKTKPLAIVTAVYSQNRFSQPAVTYTQNYVRYSEGQKNTFGGTSAGNADTTGSQQGTLDQATTDGQTTINGQGSDNEYDVTIIDNGDSDDDTGVTTNSGNNNSTTTDSNSSNTGTASTGTDPASNPNGTATWNPGGGAANTNGTSGNTTTGQWVPSDGSKSGSSTGSTNSGDGTWKPAN